MIISHKHKFIFIKTAKTAGTSIEIFLSKHCAANDVVTPISPPVEDHLPRNYDGFFNPLPEILRRVNRPRETWSDLRQRRRFYNHMRALLMQMRIPARIWRDYFKFCVERNPWDKVLSHYHMHAYRAGGALSLEEYFRRGKFPINYRRYTDRSGKNIIVDRVLRYENLNAELADVFAQLNVPFSGSLDPRAKSTYRPDHTPYSSVFSDQQRQLIEQKFAPEIALHRYSFAAE